LDYFFRVFDGPFDFHKEEQDSSHSMVELLIAAVLGCATP
jgi:hypothetical protein